MGNRYRRPKHPKKDKNHEIVSQAVEGLGGVYAGLPLYAQDVSKLGGECVDWHVWLGPLMIAFEVKDPKSRKRFTEGEEAFMENCPGVTVVVSDTQEVCDAFSLYAEAAWACAASLEDLNG